MYKVFSRVQVYLCAAPPELNLRNILWGEISEIIHRHPNMFLGDDVSFASMYVKRTPLDFIQGLTIPLQGTPKEREAKFSGKHRERILFIADEGDAVPDEVYKGIESCLSGGVWARLLVLFNPRRASGPVYFRERDGTANVVQVPAIRHPNVVTGMNIVPGAVTRETTVRRINEWTVELGKGEEPDASCFQVPEYLVGCIAEKFKKGEFYSPLLPGWRRIIESSFSYMVLAEYPAGTEEQLISQVWVDRAVSNYKEYVKQTGLLSVPGVRPIQGLDVAESPQGDLSCSTLRYNHFVAPQETWRGRDPHATGLYAADIYIPAHAIYCNVDGSGVGAGSIPAMKQRRCHANRIMVQGSVKPDLLSAEMRDLGEFERFRDQMLWLLREWLRLTPNAMLPDDPELHEELLTPNWANHPKTRKVKVDSTDIMREKLGRSPDKLMSLALTFAPPESYDCYSQGVGVYDYLGR